MSRLRPARKHGARAWWNPPIVTNLARFWEKVERRRDDECWPWLAAIDTFGAGKYRDDAGRCVKATRTMWVLTHGTIERGLQVAHRCDNSRCVNPSHLFLATNWENILDRMKKGRSRGGSGSRSTGVKGTFRAIRKFRTGRPLAERFWAGVSKAEGCWEWTGAKRNGYGVMMASLPGVYETKAHRVSYFLHYGINPVGKVVCHSCDNPACVRPDHLFLGTQADNMRDMVAKGRHVGARKLSELQVREIKFLIVCSPAGNTVLANAYGVSRRAIGMIRAERTWLNVAFPLPEGAALHGQ